MFKYKRGLLNRTAMTGYACMKTNPHANRKTNKRSNSREKIVGV